MISAYRDFTQETANFEFAIARANRLKARFVIATGDFVSDANGFASLVVMATAGLLLRSAVTRLSLFPLLLAAMPLSVGFWLLRSTWQRSRHMSVPKPTGVDLAVDFTPSISLPFEPHWRAFHFRSRHYASREQTSTNSGTRTAWTLSPRPPNAASIPPGPTSSSEQLSSRSCFGAVGLPIPVRHAVLRTVKVRCGEHLIPANGLQVCSISGYGI